MITPFAQYLSNSPKLNRTLTSLKGIGPKRAELLAQRGLTTIQDLLFFMPIRYEDRSRVLPIACAQEGPKVLVRGEVVFGGEERFFRSRKRLFRIMIKDDTAQLELIWFQYKRAHLNRFLNRGLELMAYGGIQKNRAKRQMIHPDLTLVGQDKEKAVLGVYPVYPAVNGISAQILKSLVRRALDQYLDAIEDAIPRHITRSLGLPSLAEAVRGVHIPTGESPIELCNQFKTEYHQRLTFDRFFQVLLSIAYRKRSRSRRTGPVFTIPRDLFNLFEKCFPFALTGDQVKALKEMLRDLKGGRPMNRLLQGDVGCGKTVVAAAAAYVTILNHWQVAVMVPTQILARQHHAYFAGLSESMGFRPLVLTGAMKRSDRLKAYDKIGRGEYNLIIGTQALIQEGLSFARLGLVVIDEQHRFGVRQRALLDKKGVNPHLLVMSATPIPRTLAMTVYADLDISLIKEYPEGHQPVVTHLADEREKRRVFTTLNQRMAMGQQGMVICPVIDGSEDSDLKNALEMYANLKKILTPRFRVGLIHGRVSSEEKERVMEEFRGGLIDLLVATTVIEVGVHAPGAAVMVIEHPERFGLAQLHQLRGRVGRGSERGLCVLMCDDGLPERVLARLKVLEESNDGFEIAEKDLEMRGQGELMGMRQAGAGELDFKEVFREPELLKAAKREAEGVIESDPELSGPEHQALKQMIQWSPKTALDF
jgi:ATP-dependent DNA helicase RecG